MAVIVLGALAAATPAFANDAEDIALRLVRLTTEPAVAGGCTRLGTVRDDSVKDLRKKIVRSGGNLGLLTFPLDDLSKMQADVYRCPPTPPPAPALPPGVPPPPPGTPPPPPPGPSR